MTERPTEPEAHGVCIDAQPGHARITLNGTPLPAGMVTGYVLEHDVNNSLPLLILHTRQFDGAVFDGLARVAVGEQRTPAQVITEYLAAIDPVLLDQEALNRADYGGGPGATARAMLAVLTEWARGGKVGG